MKLPRLSFAQWWRPAGVIVIGAAGAVWLLTYRLTSLAPTLSPTEQAAVAASSHLAHVATNPLDFPTKGLIWLALKLPLTPILAARLPSLILALICLGLVGYILRRWYGRRSMLFGIVLFATSAWFLHVGRFGGPDIAYLLATLALFATYIYLNDHEDRLSAWYAWLLVRAVLLFVPGLPLLVLVSAGWQWRAVLYAWREQQIWHRVASVLVPVASLGVLTTAFIWRHQLALEWLGVPTKFPGVLVWLSQLRDTALDLVWRGPHRPELWLGQLPLLDGFVIAMLAAGIFFYARHWQASRSHVLAGYLVLGIVLASFGVVSIGIVLPIVYLVAVAGIAYVLQLWLHIFPTNPIARGVGISLIAVLVGLSCTYNLAQYFVAWPRNPEVEQVYRTGR